MRRALIGIFLAPALVSAMYGVPGLIVLPVLLLITALIALPLFFAMRRAQLLQWWHALLAGAFCGICVVVFDWLAGRDLDRVINANNVYFIGLGSFIGLLYWWIGIFRNPSFPFVSKKYPKSMLVLVPVILAGTYIHESVKLENYRGRVIEIVQLPTASQRGVVSLKLTDGPVVEADLKSDWPAEEVLGKCFHVVNRWSTLRVRRVYGLVSRLGADSDNC